MKKFHIYNWGIAVLFLLSSCTLSTYRKVTWNKPDKEFIIDTVGSNKLFFETLSPMIAQGLINYSNHIGKNEKIIQIKVCRRKNKIICYFVPGNIFPDYDNANGYLLYDNRITVQVIYEKRRYAKKIMNVDSLKPHPYYSIPEDIIGVRVYDGEVDVYQIISKDSVAFLGRGFLDAKFNLHSLSPTGYNPN